MEERDVHFQTETSIDTLDYSSKEINIGSKVIWACTGEVIRKLSNDIPELESSLEAMIVSSGILAIKGVKSKNYNDAPIEIEK